MRNFLLCLCFLLFTGCKKPSELLNTGGGTGAADSDIIFTIADTNWKITPQNNWQVLDYTLYKEAIFVAQNQQNLFLVTQKTGNTTTLLDDFLTLLDCDVFYYQVLDTKDNFVTYVSQPRASDALRYFATKIMVVPGTEFHLNATCSVTKKEDLKQCEAWFKGFEKYL